MKKAMERFANLKLRTKLFISYLFFITLVLAANLLIYKIYENNTIKVIEESSTNVIEQLSNNISNKMSTFDINLLYATEASNVLGESDFSNYINIRKDINVFNMYMESSGTIVYSNLCQNLSGQCFYYNKDSSKDYAESNIYKYIVVNKDRILKSFGKSQCVTFVDEPGIVYVVKSNITLDTHISNGIVAIGISDKYFRSLFPKSLLNGSIAICDQNSKILIGDDSVKSIVTQFNKLGLEKISGQNYFNYNGSSMIIESAVSEDSRWKVLYVISLDELFKNVDSIKRIVIILCITLLVFSIAIALVISDTLTSNLRLLLKKIKSVENGVFTDKIVPKSRDETADLFNHFNIMSEKLNSLINRLAYEKIENQRAEYNALLAQINPHFLFNVLESINGLAKIRGQDEIVKIISSLSFLMRISLNSKKSMVKLKDEISYVKNYTSIQKIITGGRINVGYDIEEDALDCMVPKLIMQPIVENAINYGIEDKKTDALIVVSAHTEGKVLKINISDNGKGIEKERLDEILFGMDLPKQPPEDTHAHIGLKSVNRRLKILYGDEFGLAITSTKDVGTVVELSLSTESKTGCNHTD